MEKNRLLETIIPIRRTLHQCPELEFEEVQTAKTICDVLTEWDVPFQSQIAKTGIVAELGTGDPVILLRADMDALPVEEKTNLPFASQKKGLMHACGHDIHMSCLLGCIALMKENPPKNGRVRFVFQPAEEGDGGAEPMIREGVAKGVSAAAALHVKPGLPVGKIACKPEHYYASPDEISITVTGKGGHGAYPHLALNPLPVAAEIVTAIHELSLAMKDELCVITICALEGGACYNVIPDKVKISGTVRTFTPELRQALEEKIGIIVKKICEKYRAICDYQFIKSYPPVYNDPGLTKLLFETGEKVLGKEKVELEQEPFMGGEDFAYFAREKKGVLFHLGSGGQAPLHSPEFMADEECIWVGATMLEQFARNYLKGEV